MFTKIMQSNAECIENFFCGVDDDTYLTRMDFTARTTCPIMKTCVALDHTFNKLRVFERCNLHGTWEHEVDIDVTE